MTKRAASAAPRKDESTGRWWFVVDGGVGPDGERRQVRRRGFRTKAAAAEALDELRGARRTNAYTPPSRLTVKEYLNQWVAGLPATGLRPSTVDSYKRCLDYVIPEFGGRRLDGLGPMDLDRLYATLLVSGRRQAPYGGLSGRTVRYTATVLSRALSDAVRKGQLARNVALAASPPSPKSTRAPEMKWWTPDELRTFLDLVADEPLGPLFRLAAMTGMRRGEVVGLRWCDVDLDGRPAHIEVRHQLTVVRGGPDGGFLFSERTKTDRGRRLIDLDDKTAAALKARRSQQAEQRLATGTGWSNEHNLVFTEPDGSPLDPESVAQVFNRRVAKSGLSRIRFHDLRHTHVAHLIAAKEQPLVVAKRLGHASASFTMDKYGHLFDEAGSQAASAVAAMVDGAQSSAPRR